MGWLPDAPAVVLVALTLAAALLLVEIALPTFGLAGTSAFGLTVVAILTLGDRRDPWWPLVLVAAGVALWAVLLAGRWTSAAAQAAAAAMFGLGSIGYGILAGDPATVVLAVAGSVAVPFAFRPLARATDRLLALRPQTGMDSLVGREGVVVRWEGRAGTVRIDGTLWNARSASALSPGDEVVVGGFAGMTVDVALRAPVP
jgi:membrane protein implicated in regulation of membrane protease activity